MAIHQVTIKHVAKLAGVSCSTVSRALSGSSSVSEKTRKRILHICDKTGYRANAMARSLIRGKTNVIGLIIPDITNPFYSEIAFNAEMHANKLGYNIIVCNSTNSGRRIDELFSFLLGHRVDGIILASSHPDAASWMHKYASDLPSVLLGNVADERSKSINSVSVDNLLGGRIAAEYLLSLGHRDIVCLGYRPSSITHQFRLRGFEEAVRASGASLSVYNNPDGSSSIAHGYNLSREFFAKKPSCSAVFAISDSMAIGTMQGADECGVAIPDDISLIGFDNIMYSSLSRIALTTIDQRNQILAQAAVDLLAGIIDSEQDEVFTRRLIQPILVERSSCKHI